jgi:2-(1,2-epoxy-1,2-dihydrophenyl)acetyl-CoA isomerase
VIESSEPEKVLFSKAGGVATITLNRPAQLNALDLPTLRQLQRSVARAASDETVRCLVLTGSGRGFCAGADLKEWAADDASTNRDENPEGWATIAHRIVATLYRLHKPVLAAVNGVAVGAGFDLSLAADFRIAADTARFGAVYVRLGIPPDVGASFLLPRIVGSTKAKELIYTGRIIDAEEALRIGVVSEVVPGDGLMDTTGRWASELASGPTIAIGLAKENIQEHLTTSIETALRNEHRAGQLCMKTADHREGLDAANAKRQPEFQGR